MSGCLFALVLACTLLHVRPALGQAEEPQVEDNASETRDDTSQNDAAETEGEAPSVDNAAESPWAQGVEPASRRIAIAEFGAANDRYAAQDYVGAARGYREALDSWDHPAIHGNLAVALIHLEEPVQAMRHLELAFRWGEQPFDERIYRELQTHSVLLTSQLARVRVTSLTEDAEVALDGELVLLDEGSVERVVQAGNHRVVASREGFLTLTESVEAQPGQLHEVSVRLVPLSDAVEYERRWNPVLPWAVFASGVAVIGVGVALQLSAAGNIDEFDAEISLACPSGCNPQELPAAVDALRTRGYRQNRSAIGLLSIGSVAAVAGAALLGLNRVRAVPLDPSESSVGFAPLVLLDGGGASLSGRF